MKFRRFVLALLVLALSVSFLAITASAAAKKPAAPVVKVSNVLASGEIKLTWNKVEGAKNYQIYRASAKNGTFKKIKTTTAANFTNTAADPGDTYWYYVKAVAANGTASKNSNKVSATCKLARPQVTLSNVEGSGKIQVSWKAVAGAQHYKVYRADSKNGQYTMVRKETTTSFVNTSTEAGKTYFYKVMAVGSKEAANSAYSAVKSRMCDLPRPSIKLENVASSGKVKISWAKVEGAVKYQVYRSVNEKNWTLLKTTTNLSMVNNNGKAGTMYYYRVRAVAANTNANSAFSNVKSRMCDLPQPKNVTLSNDAATGRVKLEWTAVDGAVEYKLYRCNTKNGEFTWIKKTKETSIIDTTAEAGKTYYYKIQAVAENNEASSALTAVKSGTYNYKTTLDVAISLNEEGKPVIRWNEVKGAVSYNVYRSIIKNGEYMLLNGTQHLSMTNGSAILGVTNYYKVAAVNANGKEFKTSAIASITMPLPEGEVLVTMYTKNPTDYLYTLPDTKSDKVVIPYMSQIEFGASVNTIAKGSWHRVYYKNKLYYTWIATGAEKFTDQKSSFSYTGNTPQQQAVVDLAMYIHDNWKTYYTNDKTQSQGIPNADGRYGFDCSGFVSYVINTVMAESVPTYKITKNIGDLYRTDCIYNQGYNGEYHAQNIALEDIEPGDVIFFNQQSPIDHCGIYLGNGEFIHSNADWDNSVNIMPLSGWYLEQVASVRRYMPKQIVPANEERTMVRACKLFAERNVETDPIKDLAKGETVTVLYTNAAGNWAYIRTADGTEGNVLTQHFE